MNLKQLADPTHLITKVVSTQPTIKKFIRKKGTETEERNTLKYYTHKHTNYHRASRDFQRQVKSSKYNKSDDKTKSSTCPTGQKIKQVRRRTSLKTTRGCYFRSKLNNMKSGGLKKISLLNVEKQHKRWTTMWQEYERKSRNMYQRKSRNLDKFRWLNFRNRHWD